MAATNKPQSTKQRTAKVEADIEFTLGGKMLARGGLDPKDLRALADLLDGLKAYDPSLANIHIYGTLRKGSTIVRAVAPTEASTLLDVSQARSALYSFFNEPFDEGLGWLWNKAARTAFGKLVKLDRTLTVKVMPAHEEDEPLKKKFAKNDYDRYSTKIAEEPSWRVLNGKIMEADFKDKTFEVHTEQGIITCKFPDGILDENLKTLTLLNVTVEALCRDKPHRGAWRAEECKIVASAAPTQDVLPLEGVAKSHVLNMEEFDRELSSMLKFDEGYLADYEEYVKERYSL